MVGNTKNQKFKCDILGDFQTLWSWRILQSKSWSLKLKSKSLWVFWYINLNPLKYFWHVLWPIPFICLFPLSIEAKELSPVIENLLGINYFWKPISVSSEMNGVSGQCWWQKSQYLANVQYLHNVTVYLQGVSLAFNKIEKFQSNRAIQSKQYFSKVHCDLFCCYIIELPWIYSNYLIIREKLTT